MAIDEKLAQRLRDALTGLVPFEEKKMFGGLCLLDRGNMLAGLTKNGELMLRVGPEQYEEALARPHAREMDFTGRALKGFLYIAPEGFPTKTSLQKWLQVGLAFTGTLPAKKKKPAKARAAQKK